MTSIPLEEDKNWWWYKAKTNLLKYIILEENFSQVNNLLEIGPGLGNNLELLNNYGKVDLLEVEDKFIDYLKINYSNYINSIFKDIDDINKKYDVIVMLDVLEHIENAQDFMNKVEKIIKNDGTIIIGVPAFQSLWSRHDEELKHFRRYTWMKLETDCNRFIFKKRYGFNYLTLPLRFLQIKLNYGVNSTKNHGKFTDSVLYAISVVEHFFRRIRINPKFGISIYATLKKRTINA